MKESKTSSNPKDLLDDYFVNDVLLTVSSYQSAAAAVTSDKPSCSVDFNVEAFGQSLLQCLTTETLAQVFESNMRINYIAIIFLTPCTQIATYFQPGIKYNLNEAFGVVLSRVPGFPLDMINGIRRYLQHDSKDKGKHNNPRSFSTKELAEKGIVSYVSCMLSINFILHVYKVPTEYSQLKSVKCTVIVASVFSQELQLQLKQGKQCTIACWNL